MKITLAFFLSPVMILVFALAAPAEGLGKRIRNFRTPRLMALGGAGRGSLLLDESALLNPASVAFFNEGALFIQRSEAELSSPDQDQRDLPGQAFFADAKQEAVVISDAVGGRVKGALSYQSQYEFDSRRKTFSSAVASNIGKASSFGVLMKRVEDKQFRSSGTPKGQEYWQLDLGVTHVFSEQWSVGAVLTDPLKANSEETSASMGIQFNAFNLLSFLADAGGNYNDDISSSLFYSAGVQLQFFNHFFLRGGLFADKRTNLKGNGFGLSFSGPKLSLDFGVSYSKNLDDPAETSGNQNLLFPGESLKEVGFAGSIRF